MRGDELMTDESKEVGFYATRTVLRRSPRHPSIAHAPGQLGDPHVSSSGSSCRAFKVTPEKVRVDRVTGLRPLCRSGNGVLGRWTGGGGVARPSSWTKVRVR